MDTLAARLREAFLGTETGEAVPFDELKDAVKDRWQRVADAAAIRVPFSDDQVEALARVLHLGESNCSFGTMRTFRMKQAHAAIAHLRPTQGHVLRDRLVESEAKIERQRKNLNQLYTANAALRDDITNAVRNAMDRLPDAPWKDRTATEAVCLLSLAVGDLRAEVDEDNVAAASVNDLLVQVQNLTAERDALRERASVPVPAGVPEVKVLREIGINAYLMHEQAKRENAGCIVGPMEAAATAIRDAVLAGVAGVPIDQVEALARVFRDEHAKVMGTDALSYGLTVFCAYARVAIAHLNTRPEGLPTAKSLGAIGREKYADLNRRTPEHYDEYHFEYVAKAILTALRPWLRDPVGCDLDVRAIDMANIMHTASVGAVSETWKDTAAQRILDLCRSRQKPVYECKECAKAEAECRQWRNANDELVRRATAARAALEGE